MVIWRITGNEIGHNGTNACYFATKEEADREVREHNKWKKEHGSYPDGDGPDKIVIRNREDMAAQLNAATGYGGN